VCVSCESAVCAWPLAGDWKGAKARWRAKRRGWGHWMARVASARISEDDGMACMSLWERAAVLMEGVGSACARMAREAGGGEALAQSCRSPSACHVSSLDTFGDGLCSCVITGK